MKENKMNKKEVINHAMSFKFGGMSENELSYLYDICIDKTVLELGSMAGMSSYVIASVAQNLSCVDVWNDTYDHLSHDLKQKMVYLQYRKEILSIFKKFNENCKNFILSGKIRIYRGNTIDMANEFLDKSFDIVLIDADHSYRGVSQDFKLYKDKVKDGGLIVFHDYGDSMWTGVATLANEMAETGQIEIIGRTERIGVFRKL